MTRLDLEAGDTVVLVSDGVIGGRPDLWLRETVSAFGGESPKDLARSLIDAQEAPGSDDRTALVVRLERRKL